MEANSLITRRKEQSLLSKVFYWFFGEEDKPKQRKRSLKKRAISAAKREGDDDLANQIRRGEIKGDELRDLIKSGELRIRNPGATAAPTRMSSSDRHTLETAQRMSQQFHGTPDQVVELSREERILPRFAVVAGRQRKITYETPPESKRAGVVWEHESGDRGAGKPKSSKAPLLLVDPETKTVFTVKDKSPMKFSSRSGIVG